MPRGGREREDQGSRAAEMRGRSLCFSSVSVIPSAETSSFFHPLGNIPPEGKPDFSYLCTKYMVASSSIQDSDLAVCHVLCESRRGRGSGGGWRWPGHLGKGGCARVKAYPSRRESGPFARQEVLGRRQDAKATQRCLVARGRGRQARPAFSLARRSWPLAAAG